MSIKSNDQNEFQHHYQASWVRKRVEKDYWRGEMSSCCPVQDAFAEMKHPS